MCTGADDGPRADPTGGGAIQSGCILGQMDFYDPSQHEDFEFLSGLNEHTHTHTHRIYGAYFTLFAVDVHNFNTHQ